MPQIFFREETKFDTHSKYRYSKLEDNSSCCLTSSHQEEFVCVCVFLKVESLEPPPYTSPITNFSQK